jgi:hypothetical protein
LRNKKACLGIIIKMAAALRVFSIHVVLSPKIGRKAQDCGVASLNLKELRLQAFDNF